MCKRALFAILSILLVQTFTGAAFAERIIASKDWVLDDSSPKTPEAGECVASTGAYLNREAYALSLIVDKSGVRPLEVLVRPYTGVSAVKLFGATPVTGKTYYFPVMPKSVWNADFFWNVPRDTETLINYLISKNQFNVRPLIGGAGVLPFSLSGSSVVIREMQKRCTAKSLFAAAGFEKEFLPPEIATFDGLKLTPDIGLALRDLIPPGQAAYLEVVKIRQELQDLEAKNAQWIRERDTLRTNLDQWINRDLPALRTARADAQSRIDTANREIAQLRQSITTEEGKLRTAQAAYDAAKAAIQPHLPEHDRLLALKNADQRRVRNAETALANLDQDIATKTQEVQDLEAEADRLDVAAGENRTRLRRARDVQAQAERDLRGFDVQREIRERVNNDRRIQRLNREIDDLREQLRLANNVVRDAERTHEEKRRALRECERTAGADCTNQRNELNQAENELRTARRQKDQVEREFTQRQAQRDRIGREIESEVLAEQRRLENRVNEARSQVEALEDRGEQIQDRLDAINLRELPRVRDELSAARAERPTRVSELTNARADLSRSTADYDAFKRRVGYDRLQAQVDSTLAEVNRIKGVIAGLNTQVADRENIVRTQTTRRDSLDQQIVTLENTIREKQIRLAELDKLLADFDREKTAIQGRLTAAEQALAAISRQFANILPR